MTTPGDGLRRIVAKFCDRQTMERLVEPIVAHVIDLVFCCGPLMHSLWEALPSERRGRYAETSAALEPLLLASVRSGDAIMVKGSLGSRMGPLVKTLLSHFQRPHALAASTDTNVASQGTGTQ